LSTQKLFNDSEAAAQLGVSPSTLRSWRCRGIGPSFVKMGRGRKSPVRYHSLDLEQFIAESRRVPSVRAAFEG
jgi:phage terminase Nu1 subunit (DNA packaging protein)